MCPACLITVKTFETTCRNYLCNARTFEIDELMIEAITELNKKGYETTFCCSGHSMAKTDSYIAFKEHHEFPTLPPGWRLEHNSTSANKTIIRNDHKSRSEWFDNLKSLHNWSIN